MACNSRPSRLRASYAKSKGMSMPRVHASRTCVTVLTSTVAVRCSSSPFVVWPKAVAAVASRTHAASLQPAPPVVRRLPRPGTLQAPARYSCQMPCSEARCVPGLASAPDIPLLVTLPDPVAMGDQRHTEARRLFDDTRPPTLQQPNALRSASTTSTGCGSPSTAPSQAANLNVQRLGAASLLQDPL